MAFKKPAQTKQPTRSNAQRGNQQHRGQQARPNSNAARSSPQGRQHVAHRASDPPQQQRTQTRPPPHQDRPQERTDVTHARRQVATRPMVNVPAELDDLDRQMMEDSGMGTSSAPEDNLVPSILVLQPLSPQVIEGPAQMEDANPGDILLRGAGTTVPGDEGFWFQPCERYDKWMQFIPRDEGGGFVAAYDFEPGVVDRKNLPDGAEFDPQNRNRAYFPDSSNECVHYHFVAGFLWDENGNALEYVIPFKGTGHSIARAWNTTRLRQRFHNGMPMPAAANLYHLTTTAKRNKKGQWYVFEIGAPVFIKSEEGVQIVGGDPVRAYKMGQSLASAINSGAKIIGVEEDHVIDETDGGVVYDESGQDLPEDARV